MRAAIILIIMLVLVSSLSSFVIALNPVIKSGTSYIIGNMLVGQIDASDEMLLYQLDARGDVRSVIAQSDGTVVNMQDFYPFGNVSSYGMDSRHGYKTVEFDDIIKLYSGAYDPEIGRFIIPRSVDIDPFEPVTLTPFVKDRNNPYRVFSRQEIFPDVPDRNQPVALIANPPPQAIKYALPSSITGGSASGMEFSAASRLWFTAMISGMYNIINPATTKQIVTSTNTITKTIATTKMITVPKKFFVTSWIGLSEHYPGGFGALLKKLTSGGTTYKLMGPDGIPILQGETGPGAVIKVLGKAVTDWSEGFHRKLLEGSWIEFADEVQELAQSGTETVTEIVEETTTTDISGGKFCGIG